MKPQSASEQKSSIQGIRGPVVRHVKRRPGRPRKGEEKHPINKPKRSWSRKTMAYVKMVTEGKGAPCKVWSLREKKQLLLGLQKYSHQDWDSLCNLIPSRTKEEIQEYIHNLKGGEQSRTKTKEGNDVHLTWAPIESWLDMSSEMVHYEQTDLSNILSRVFSVIGHFGNFPQVDGTSTQLVPDYGKLYRYVAAVMDESLTMPELSPLESAIMADLMHSLGDLLRVSDTSLQRKVMCWKYKMLNYKFEFYDVRASLDRIRKALTNDFSDLQRDGNRGVSGLPSFTHTPASTEGQAATASAERDAASPLVSSRPSGAATPGMASPPQPGQSPRNGSVSSSRDPVPGPSSAADAPRGSSPRQQADSENGDDQPKPKKGRGRGRPRLHDWRRPIEKPRLFTMNPFCVPIRLLRLKPLQEAASSNVSPSGAAVSPGVEVPPGLMSPPRTGRQRSLSVSSIHSDTSNQSTSQPGLSVQAEKAEATNNIRQVTGLYVPKVVRKNKSRLQQKAPVHQASANIIRAISDTLTKRNKDRETAGPHQLAARASPQMVQMSNTGNGAFRCIRLHDGNMALVPLHLSQSSTLSHLQMREAMPVSRQMPALKACPAVRNQAHQVASSSTAALPVWAPDTNAAMSAGMLGHVQAYDSAQSAVLPHGSVSVAHLHPSIAAALQNGAPYQTSDPDPGPCSAAQFIRDRVVPPSDDSEPQESIQVQLALPVWAFQDGKLPLQNKEPGQRAPSRKGAHSPEHFSRIISFQQREDGSTVKQLAQIVPQKRKGFTRPNTPRGNVITTEIFVAPPPGARIETETSGRPSKTESPPKAKGKKARTAKCKRSKAVTEPSSTEPDQSDQTADGTPEAQESQTVPKKKAASRKRKIASKSLAVAENSLQKSTPEQNVGENTRLASPADCSSSDSNVSNFMLQATEDPSTKKSVPSTDVSQTTAMGICYQVSGIHPLQTQSHSTASATSQLKPEQNRKPKSSFKSIQAQVASSFHVPLPNTTPGKSKAVSSNRVSDSGHKNSSVANTNSEQKVPSSSPSTSSSLCSSSSSPSCSKKLKLTKNFLSAQKHNAVNPPQSKGKGKKASGGTSTSLSKGKKRAPNFLDDQDISGMQVEIVTPEDAKGRLMASLSTTVDKRTQNWKQSAQTEQQLNDNVINFVVDDDAVSLVSI